MRYIDGMLPDRAFKKSLFKNAPETLEGGGPSQAPTPSSQTVTNNPIADWAQPTATALIGSSMSNAFNIGPNGEVLSSRGFTPFGGQTNAQGQFTGSPISQQQYNDQLKVAGLGVAGPSALQQQSYQGAANLQMPGQYNQASQFTNTAGLGALGTTDQARMFGMQGNQAGQNAANESSLYGNLGAQSGQQYAGLSANAGQQGSQAGQQYANQLSGYGSLGSQAGQQYANQLSGYGMLGAQAGQQGGNIGASLGRMSTDPNSVQSYMNPYLQASLNPQLAEIQRQYGITGTQQAGQATQSGAFGGGRDAIMAAENERNKNTAMNQVIGQGYNTAFNNAQQQMNTANQAALAGNQQALSGYGMGLQGSSQAGQQALAGNQQALTGAYQAGQQALAGNQQALSGYGQAGQQALSGYGMGLQGANQAGQQRMQGIGLGLQGVGAQQAGYGQAGQAGSQLASIGGQQLQAQQGILGTQNQMGTQEQQNQQNVLNQAIQNYSNQQQYPQQQTANIMNLLRSTPTSQTQTMYQAPPSATSQLAGLGTTAYAASNLIHPMAGGGIAKVKKFDVGGSVENQLYKMPTQPLTEEVNTTPSQTIKNTGNAILKERQLGTTPAFAPGGIVAFAEGGESDIIPVEIPEDDEMIGNPMGEFTMPSRIMSASKPTVSAKPKTPINVFEKAMEFVLPHEGGFVNHPKDRGGATNKGITQRTLSDYLQRPATLEDVKNLDTNTAIDIYKTKFFEPIARKLDDPKAQMVAFNAAIASGPSYANKLIEKNKGDPLSMLNEHTNFMVHEIPKKDPSQKVFVPGWTNRQNDLGKYIETFAEGGIAHFDEGGSAKEKAIEALNMGMPENAPSNLNMSLSDYYSLRNKALKGIEKNIPSPISEESQRARSSVYGRLPNISTDTNNLKPSNMADTTDYYRMESAANPPSSKGLRPAPSQPSAPNEFNVQPSITQMGPDADLANEPSSQTEATQTAQAPSARDTIQQMLMDRMSKQGESAEQDKYLALLNAGLGIMGGTSPYALQNIGAGGQLGIAAQMANKRNQMSEQNSILNGMLGLERANATDRYHTTQLAQNLDLRKAEIDARLQNAQLTHQDRQELLAEKTRLADLIDKDRDLNRADKAQQFSMTMLGNMEKNAQAQALAELKLNPMALMGKSADEINAIVAPRIREILNNPRYRDLYKNTYKGYDPYETTETPVSKDRKPLTVFQK